MILKVFRNLLLLTILFFILFIAYQGNQPMSVAQAPQGMTYFKFISDRIHAAKTVRPSQCGWGMIVSLVVLGPVYSVVYTVVAVNPEGLLAKVTAPDADIARDAANATWVEIPGIWWETVERLSWTMLGNPIVFGCQFRPIQITGHK